MLKFPRKVEGNKEDRKRRNGKRREKVEEGKERMGRKEKGR